MAKHNLKRVKKSSTGLNKSFIDSKGNYYSRTDFIKNKKLRDKYKVHIVTKSNGIKYVRSNRSKKSNKLK